MFIEPFPKYIHDHDHLKRYQTAALHYLKKKAGTSKDNITLVTSGTVSGKVKEYKYSRTQFKNIDKYHFNKICHLNDLDPTLRVVWIVARGCFKDDSQSTDVKGPTAFTCLSNNVYRVVVPYNANKQQWEKTYDAIIKLHPKLVYTTPSTFMSSSFSLNDQMPKLDCPAMFTCETLFDDVRSKALKTFTSVIDKMRAWDTGLSFIECRYGTKHIDDELCLAEQNEHNEIISTDFFNYSKPYALCKTDDLGTIQTTNCQCGIYGRTFSKFTGKTTQCLWDENGIPCDPHLIIGYISSFLKSNGGKYVPYLIRQKKNGTIVLFTEASESAQIIKDTLAGMLHQPVQIRQYKDASKNSDNKLLLITSEFSLML